MNTVANPQSHSTRIFFYPPSQISPLLHNDDGVDESYHGDSRQKEKEGPGVFVEFVIDGFRVQDGSYQFPFGRGEARSHHHGQDFLIAVKTRLYHLGPTEQSVTRMVLKGIADLRRKRWLEELKGFTYMAALN